MEEKDEIKEAMGYVKREIEQIDQSIEAEIKKFKDPVVHAGIMYAVVRERESANLLLKNILSKMETIETKLARLERKEEVELSEIDKRILSFIKERRQACAGEIQVLFDYKGKNAACARLSRLSELGILKKKRAGKRIYYSGAKATDVLTGGK